MNPISSFNLRLRLRVTLIDNFVGEEKWMDRRSTEHLGWPLGLLVTAVQHHRLMPVSADNAVMSHTGSRC